MAKYSIEKFIKVYNDETGDYTQAGPDSDGLDLIEVSQHYKDGARVGRGLTLTKDECVALICALQAIVDD